MENDDRKPTIVGVPVTTTMKAQLEALAKERVWSRAQAARYVIELGFDALEAEEAAA